MEPEDLIDLMVTAIIQTNTAAGASVYAFRDWNQKPEGLPMITFGLPIETLESEGRSTPQYTATADIPLTVRAALKADPGDATGLAIQALLSTFRRQIKRAVLNNTAIFRQIQQIKSVASRGAWTLDGGYHFGQLEMVFRPEWYVGPEDLHDNAPPTFDEMDLTALIVTSTGDTPFPQDFVFTLTT
jgi:hypothetical protein